GGETGGEGDKAGVNGKDAKRVERGKGSFGGKRDDRGSLGGTQRTGGHINGLAALATQPHKREFESPPGIRFQHQYFDADPLSIAADVLQLLLKAGVRPDDDRDA